MKAKFTLLTTALAAAAAIFLSHSGAQEPAPQAPKRPEPAVPALPYDANCVVTLQPCAWPGSGGTAGPGFGSGSGIAGDFTLRGKLVSVTPEWVILRDGSFENWIPRDKVLNLRVSR